MTHIKQQISFGSVLSVGYNTNFIISKAQYTTNRYLLFYVRHGPYTLDKTVKVFSI